MVMQCEPLDHIFSTAVHTNTYHSVTLLYYSTFNIVESVLLLQNVFYYT